MTPCFSTPGGWVFCIQLCVQTVVPLYRLCYPSSARSSCTQLTMRW